MEKEKEQEIVTFDEMSKKGIKEEEMLKIALVCKNCGHRDLLKNFLKKIEMNWGKNEVHDEDDLYRKPQIKPYRLNPNKYYTTQQDKVMLAMFEDYEGTFACPKCGSALVCLDEKFIKNNMMRGI